MEEIILNKKKSERTLKINKEQPFIEITHFRVPGFMPDPSRSVSLISGLQIKCELFRKNEFASSTILSVGTDIVMNTDKSISNWFEYNHTINYNSTHDEIKLSLHNFKNFDYSLELLVSYHKEKISIQDPWDEFRNHLEEEDNINILFSAPFGQGKTTFLNEFFRQQNHHYNVFRIYPVNYSVSTNEDIFKYIKAEILFQLLKNENIEFKKEEISYLKTAPKFFLRKAPDVIAPFIKLLPNIGRSAYEIYENLIKLSKEYFEEHDKIQKDDKKKTHDYLASFYEQEGSIFEVNFFTELIRILLKQLSDKSNRQNVLIIDDLDRMDPEHVFRILNVLSAHFDSPAYGIETGLPNKFGFHKIIIVGDYSNLSKIFAHKYGALTDFGGYINKYYSKSYFPYDNKKAIRTLIENTEATIKSRSIIVNVVSFVLKDLLETDNLSLREILKWQNTTYIANKKQTKNYVVGFNNGVFEMRTDRINSQFVLFYVIYLLLKIWDIDILIGKLHSCMNKCEGNNLSRASFNLTEIGGAGLLVFAKGIKFKKGEQHLIPFNGKDFYLDINEKSDALSYDYLYCSKMEDKTVYPAIQHNISPKEFYEILIINAQNYYSRKGMDK